MSLQAKWSVEDARYVIDSLDPSREFPWKRDDRVVFVGEEVRRSDGGQSPRVGHLGTVLGYEFHPRPDGTYLYYVRVRWDREFHSSEEIASLKHAPIVEWLARLGGE